jgi:hypothetical protein
MLFRRYLEIQIRFDYAPFIDPSDKEGVGQSENGQ